MNYNAYLVEIRAKSSAGLGSKEKPKKNGIFGVLPARKMGRES